MLGVEKAGEDWYQVLLGGRADGAGALGALTGKAVRDTEVPLIIERLAQYYLSAREPGESFIDAVERLGVQAFKTALEPAEAA